MYLFIVGYFVINVCGIGYLVLLSICARLGLGAQVLWTYAPRIVLVSHRVEQWCMTWYLCTSATSLCAAASIGARSLLSLVLDSVYRDNW